MQAETQFGIKLDRRLKALDNCWFVNIQQVAIRGIPDRIGCLDGKFFALEMKRDGKAKRAKLQEYIVDKIKGAGGYAEFVYPENMEQVLKELEQWAKPKPYIQEIE